MNKAQYTEHYRYLLKKQENKKSELVSKYLREYKKTYAYGKVYITIEQLFTEKENEYKCDLGYLFLNILGNINGKTANKLFFKTQKDYENLKHFSIAMQELQNEYYGISKLLNDAYEGKRDSSFLNIPCYLSHNLI